MFLYPLSKGKNNSDDLPFFSKAAIVSEQTLNDSINNSPKNKEHFIKIKETFDKQYINDFVFYDEDSNAVSSETTKGKTLIVSTLIPSCPTYCPILQKQLKFLVYDKLYDRPAFKDLLFISHLIDTNGNNPNLKAFLGEQENINTDSWKIVTGADNPIYDFEIPTGNIKSRECDTTIQCIGGKPYYQMILLVDRERRVRGMYQGNQTQLIERLRGEIRKLFIEYVHEDKAKEKKQS